MRACAERRVRQHACVAWVVPVVEYVIGTNLASCELPRRLAPTYAHNYNVVSACVVRRDV